MMSAKSIEVGAAKQPRPFHKEGTRCALCGQKGHKSVVCNAGNSKSKLSEVLVSQKPKPAKKSVSGKK
ncbi:hypothetical protein BDFG_09399 [Blastomyces dermatitidis ATCC 26199]|nr:hypothetical protein BDFG_09399 [Blastomyces dermatitidis ATCC 26199]